MTGSTFEFDPENIDLDALVRELKEIRESLKGSVGQNDLEHLAKIERWGKTCTRLGYGTAWIAPNPFSSFMISQGMLTRWLLMHHVSHRGYDRVPGVPPEYTSKEFARGIRRLVDWMDWIYPEAWHEEHDILHHYNLGEEEDPDLLERNSEWMREAGVPLWARYAMVGLLACTWKWIYYAPSTMRELQRIRARRRKEDPPVDAPMFSPFNERGRETWLKCLLPHAIWRFGVIPAAYLPLTPVASFNVLMNSLGAEVLTNIHAFLIIGPNHTGSDLYRFEEPILEHGEFYLRQIIGSANYDCGGDLRDWMQAWLNYQIEHHIWPDLTMLQYQKVQPMVKALCQRHGIPYVQESVFTRARKMVDVIVGKAQMPTISTRRFRATAAAAE